MKFDTLSDKLSFAISVLSDFVIADLASGRSRPENIDGLIELAVDDLLDREADGIFDLLATRDAMRAGDIREQTTVLIETIVHAGLRTTEWDSQFAVDLS